MKVKICGLSEESITIDIDQENIVNIVGVGKLLKVKVLIESFV